ncbi:DUF2970 domain-containing protein [Sessilibacter corallicola]|uniref:DUF2970 domain-containing protein n=1 Tax=Sessilibacter corallicola TaxID=2904075 RepID=UPI001E4B6C19|nr:DUF2970 domain-containing protein [Sessilibacter corallicola]MCE2030117.1 DUF2970 domain-containing protein [Sessilibacter corallicola]
MNQDKLSFWQVLLSILAAAFGVQSQKNQERDFSRNRVVVFVVGGVLFTVVFVVSLAFLVQWIIQSSAG